MSYKEGIVYIAAPSSKERPATEAFLRKGLNNLTAERPSALQILGKPRTIQLAYSGYRDNIESFMFATVTGTKVLTSVKHLPLPDELIPLVPHLYPQTIFALAKASSKEAIKRMVEKLEDEGIRVIKTAQGEVYSLSKPSFKTLHDILPKMAKPVSISQAAHAQVESAATILRVYQCVDAFLATNIYYYRKEEFTKGGKFDRTRLASQMDLRLSGYGYRGAYDEKEKKMKYDNIQPEGKEETKTRVDDEEMEDVTPDRIGTVSAHHVVAVAQPTRADSSVNFGSPNDIPNAGGMLFPFFPNMALPDNIHIRDVVGRRFFRNLGKPGEDVKLAYKTLRANIGTIGSTPGGIQLGHILSGVDLALQTQTQLFLIFERTVYLGFALLGEEFDVFAQGVWHAPVNAETLRSLTVELSSHSGVIERLVEKLNNCTLSTTMTVTAESIDTSKKLADVLSKVVIDKNDEDEVNLGKEIGDLIGRLNYEGTYRKINPKNVVWAIEMMTSGTPLPPDLHVYIPRENWGDIGSKEYQVLASFGPKSFHFRDTKGDDITVPRGVDSFDIFNTTNSTMRQENLVVFEDGIRTCVGRWREFVAKGQLRVNYKVRSLGVKAFRYGGDNLKMVWNSMKKLKEKGLIGNETKVSEPRVDGVGAVVARKDIASATVDDFF